MAYAAYYAARVAREMGLYRDWLSGDLTAIKTVAEALPVTAAMFEQESRERVNEMRGLL